MVHIETSFLFMKPVEEADAITDLKLAADHYRRSKPADNIMVEEKGDPSDVRLIKVGREVFDAHTYVDAEHKLELLHEAVLENCSDERRDYLRSRFSGFVISGMVFSEN